MAASGVAAAKGDEEHQILQLASLGSVFPVAKFSGVLPSNKLIAGYANDAPRFLVEHGDTQIGREH